MTTTEYEDKGRRKLIEDFKNSKCEIEYEFTKGKFDSIDCFATASTGDKYAVEIKNRDISIDKYDDVMMELHKYNALMIAYEESGYTPIFRIYYKDGKLSYNLLQLKDIENRVEEMKCTQTTVDYGHKVVKKIIMLKKEEAIDKKRNYRKTGQRENGRDYC